MEADGIVEPRLTETKLLTSVYALCASELNCATRISNVMEMLFYSNIIILLIAFHSQPSLIITLKYDCSMKQHENACLL